MAMERADLGGPGLIGARTGRLVWTLAALACAPMGLGLVPGLALVARGDGAALLSHQLVGPLFVVSYALMGGLIASRQPRNPIGWLFVASGLLAASSYLAAMLALVEPWGRAAEAAALSEWLDGWLYIPALFLPTLFVFLYFPDGRLPGPRWRPLAWVSALGVGVVTLAMALHPGPVEMWGLEVNPYGVADWKRPLDGIIALGSLMLMLGFGASIAALVIRYRASRGRVRLQMKWLVYAAGIVVLGFVVSAIVWLRWSDSVLLTEMGIALSTLTQLGIPVAAAVAISRHRLYDIDLIISRTLVYGTLTAVVALLYIVTVAVTAMALQHSSRLAALLLTLTLAAPLLRPAQRRLQRVATRLVTTASPAMSGAGAGGAGMATAAAGTTSAAESAPAARWWWRPARIGWLLLAIVAVALLLLGVPLLLQRRPMGDVGAHLLYRPTAFMLAVNRINLVTAFAAVLSSYALATLLYLRRPRSAVALFLAYFLLLHGLLLGGAIELLDPLWPGASVVNSFVLLPLIYFPLTFLLLAIFPNGRFVPSWTRWLAPLALPLGLLPLQMRSVLPVGEGVSAAAPWWTLLAAVGALAWLAPFGAVVYAQIHRYRRVSTPLERQQTKWVLYGYVAMSVLLVGGSVPWGIALALPPGSLVPWWLPLAESTWVIALAVLPVALTVAVLRYRLYDIDLIISRTLVYGGLTTLVVAIYVLIVGALATLFRSQDNLVIALLATGLVAALFQPLRARLQRTVNRLVYGERDDPSAVLARLGRRLEASLEPGEVFPTLTETVAQALKLPYVAVGLRRGDDLELVAEYGRARSAGVRLQLQYQDETFGELIVEPRGRDLPFDEAERRLLETVARQASAAAHAARLDEDLRRSRERLVSAREEERRRLRRDLHDGLGPRLASQALKLEAARDLLAADPQRAAALIDGLLDQSRDALQEVRRLVYDLRPPALDELGLVAALREYLTHELPLGLRFELETPPSLPALPAAVEVAAYRIVQEGVTNVIRHAAARRCRVRLALPTVAPRSLVVEVCDDGTGLADDRPSGVGLGAMRERAEELGGSFLLFAPPGGGTCLRALLPLTPQGG